MIPYTVPAHDFGRQCASLGFDYETSLYLLRHSDVADRGNEYEFDKGYGGRVHFVGFRGDEYHNAVRVFGRPDFIHRINDPRFRHGGELAPYDTVVYARGSENDVRDVSFDDSAAFLNLER